MPSGDARQPDPARLSRWFESLARRDPELHRQLSQQRAADLAREGVTPESAAGQLPPITLETIVRHGRPALLIRDQRVVWEGAVVEDAAREVLERLRAAAGALEPLFPLVGRIDIANFPGALPYAGTGWLADQNLLVTNRHVAELLASASDSTFVFRPGRFGEPLDVSVDYRHELGSSASAVSRVVRVVWIERNPRKADIAFLEVAPVRDGARGWIRLAGADASADTPVAVVGYPARAPAHIIPDQAWMERIYGGAYDVKRIAPGLAGALSRGWATHDCTTLGGNSGSVVLDMRSGEAVALHFAGLFMVENYAVPASQVRQYLTDRPWQGGARVTAPDTRQPEVTRPAPQARQAPDVQAPARAASASITVPLTITVTLGEPVAGAPQGADQSAPHRGAASPPPAREPNDIDEAAGALAERVRGDGVLAVRPGFVIDDGRMTDYPCLVVSADPPRVDEVRGRVPATFAGLPVEVRAASISDQLEGLAVAEAVTAIAYNDEDRTGEGFSFDWIDEPMSVLLHVGPERSWLVLSEFLAKAQRSLVSSMYEFHAEHVAAALEKRLEDGTSLQLVLGTQSRDHGDEPPEGDFARAERFEAWTDRFARRFKNIFVPQGANGLVANAYHIKVTVRDGRHVWLSSGNWKRSSQPVIADADLDDPKVTNRAGNREWHVVIDNERLASRLQNHIRADFQRSIELGGEPEAPDAGLFVDVPAGVLEGAELEAAPARVLQPLPIERRVKVKPLLTPDRQGRVYCDAVLALIRSARTQLLFQNQYIKMASARSGFLKKLVDALVDRATSIDDFRVILRNGDSFADDVAALKRRGVDVNACVRRLPNTHTKGIVVDGRRVLVGSHNWSAPGVTLNRDASLIFDDTDVAQYFAEAFELDWERAGDLVIPEAAFGEGARLATGPEPPPGFVRVPLAEYLEG
jgi:phosphatidylserine/phosphatidylglycerophosphate/cardiolipin synthase-like enzyme